MNKPFRVFLCSTFADLSDERQRVLESIQRLQLHHDSMEFFGAHSNIPIKTCLEEVRRSDVLVVIVGARYGNLVPRRRVSFSEAEYREGHRLGKPCLVYIRDENVPVIPKYVERDPDKQRALERWKQTLLKRHTAFTFSESSSLAVQVTADLSRTVQMLEESKKAKSAHSRAAEVTSAIERAAQLRQALRDLEHASDVMLEALGDVLELAAKEDPGHCKRVTSFAIAISRGMGLSTDRIRLIARGAYLHDIGKIAISDQILQKRGPLTAEERTDMQMHCLNGYYILKKIPFLSESAEFVYAHHERYDGTGYPRQLKGSDIPLGARIIAVAEALDVITSGTPYRAANSISDARKEIVQLAGTHFDPEVVSIFADMPETIWEDLRKEIMAQVRLFSRPFHAQKHSGAHS